jgi:hypothetical protein
MWRHLASSFKVKFAFSLQLQVTSCTTYDVRYDTLDGTMGAIEMVRSGDQEKPSKSSGCASCTDFDRSHQTPKRPFFAADNDQRILFLRSSVSNIYTSPASHLVPPLPPRSVVLMMQPPLKRNDAGECVPGSAAAHLRLCATFLVTARARARPCPVGPRCWLCRQ